MDEFDAIARYFRPLTRGRSEALDLKDDAALITPPPGKELVVTTDSIQQGIHFFGHESPALIARKALRVNLSDLAAKGATPYCYFLTLGVPKTFGINALAAFTEGLKQDQQQFDIFLAGGDTTNSKEGLNISITALGWVEKGSMLRRNRAKPSDEIYITGTIGDSAAGLEMMRKNETRNSWLLNRYLLPEPRLSLGLILAEAATAAMDVSDGLVQDVAQLCRASEVGAEIDTGKIPLSDNVRKYYGSNPPLEKLITGGDDYEILFTAPPGKVEMMALASRSGIAITRIGKITASTEIKWKSGESELNFEQGGYRHQI